MRVALAAGAALGLLYTLSPLTVLSLAALTALALALSGSMAPRERRWFLGVVASAMALRLAAIALLFLLADPSQPFASFFGDEEMFKSRTVWLRNVSAGVAVSPADMIYAFDEVGRSRFLYLLAYIQVLVGDAPYGANVLNACWYAAAVILLHWLLRRAFGAVVALGSTLVLVFLPSLFSWSISVLKEPLYLLVAVLELILAVQIVRAPGVALRGAAAVAVIACGFLLEGIRQGGWLLATVGTTAGIAGALVMARPRVALASVAALPLVVLMAWSQPAVRDRTLKTVQEAAFQHWGHVVTPGYSYRLLDDRIYWLGNRLTVYQMTPGEAGRYVVRAFASFVTVPRPSQIESWGALAYLPEQAVWYAILFLVPIGAVAGFRRDPIVTALLLSHGLAAAGMVALTGGNIGTLIRHRGLSLPYFSALAAVGGYHAIGWLMHRHHAPAVSPLPAGEQA